jgi:CheY-like chemotaxis protein
MEVVGQLTGGVAHDFNNLLGVILGNLDLLDAVLEGKPEEQRILQRAIGAVERGGSLTRQLLAFSRKQMLTPQSIDVDHLLLDLAALLRRTLGESYDVSTKVTPDLWHCRADRTQLETALLNLSLNARDAMAKGGRLVLDGENFVIDDAYAAKFAEVQPGEYVVISVTDNGSGMPPEVTDRAFEPFFTTKEVGKGSGLGLSMVYGFIKQSGGHVRLYSEPGIGTVVKLFLPRATDGVIRAKPTPDTIARGEGQLILVVEDNVPLRQVAVISLNNLGYATLEAGTVDEAIVILEQHDDIALLFTDIVLPGGRNGFELAAVVRERWPGLKVLFASGHPNVAQSAEAVAAGAVIVPKPFRVSDLARHVRAMLDS